MASKIGLLGARLYLLLTLCAAAFGSSPRYNLSDPQDAAEYAHLLNFNRLEENSSITVNYTSRRGQNRTITYARRMIVNAGGEGDHPFFAQIHRRPQERQPANLTYLPGRRQPQRCPHQDDSLRRAGAPQSQEEPFQQDAVARTSQQTDLRGNQCERSEDGQGRVARNQSEPHSISPDRNGPTEASGRNPLHPATVPGTGAKRPS